MSKVVVVEQDASSVVEVSTPGPQGPAWPSEVVKAASEAARDAAQAAAQAAAASSASAGGYRDAAGDSAAVAEVASTNAATSAGTATTKAAEAAASAATANTKAGEASGSAASALAIYGNTAAMNTAVTTATTQAAAAAASAASAASVLQQDLSAVSAALHRSPNAITAMAIYDTSKDSDGGAWVEKCQHTSWFNEPLNGSWLGACASESAARAVSGAATGSYFQLTTDGKFYKLNAGSGTTEVFRGNKAKFPRLAGIVAEASNVTIYDLSEAGRPMWMRFRCAYNDGMFQSSDTFSSLAAVNGSVAIGANNTYGCIALLNFPTEHARRYRYNTQALFGAYNGVWVSTFARRNTGQMWDGKALSIASDVVNAVAMTVLPDAPVDVVTGLKVPTIAVATAGGISVIQHSGTVRNSSSTSAYLAVTLTPGLLSAQVSGAATWAYASAPGNLGASFALSTIAASAAPDFARGNGSKLMQSGRSLARSPASALVNLLRHNESPATAGVASLVADTYSTGYLVGDIRRCYLADTVVESVGPSTELVTNGGFNADLAGWAFTQTGSGSSLSWSASGYAVLSGIDFANRAGMASTGFPTIVGRAYTASMRIVGGTSASAYLCWGNSPAFSAGVGYRACPGVGVYKIRFIATNTTTYINILDGAAGGTVFIDDVSVQEVIPDRSYKDQGALIYGTLTKALTASANQLVACSGFSAANYLREPYSADLDFGTGEWSVGAWVNYTTAVASIIASRAYSSGGTIVLGTDATGKLTATAFDGTTTRTVTTTAAYNTATWLKAVANYRAGRLAIEVNGVEVAATTGAPLLTLNNSNAVLTIGNSYALDAPFPGSIALLKLGATVPSPEQSLWMYEQEKAMFRDGAQVTLPSSGAVVDLTYDEAQDKWVALQATHESSWTGLVRTAVTTPSAGSFSKVEAKSGIKLQARTTTTPGVDVILPAMGLKEELVRRAEAAAAQSRQLQVFDFDAVGFTAAMTSGSPTVTASSIVGTPYIGMGITGTGVPANTTIIGINGTTYTLSANCTATAGNAVAQSTFTLPAGWTATEVIAAGASQREGTTKQFTRKFDGFRETVQFAVSPGSAAWVQITARKDT